jgi:hypothetical protein
MPEIWLSFTTDVRRVSSVPLLLAFSVSCSALY